MRKFEIVKTKIQIFFYLRYVLVWSTYSSLFSSEGKGNPGGISKQYKNRGNPGGISKQYKNRGNPGGISEQYKNRGNPGGISEQYKIEETLEGYLNNIK